MDLLMIALELSRDSQEVCVLKFRPAERAAWTKGFKVFQLHGLTDHDSGAARADDFTGRAGYWRDT